MKEADSILITGGSGLVGKNLSLYLSESGYISILSPTSEECDLADNRQVDAFFAKHKPSHVFHLAGRVRGLGGNINDQGVAYYDNIMINTNVVEACHRFGVKKIVAMGTVAMYPDPLPRNPLAEDSIWQGKPHHSEYGYAQAKRAMLAQLEAYGENYGLPWALVLSTNLYGPYDRFDTKTGHVIPSLIRKFHDAKTSGGTVQVWGDGSATRDFLYVKDTVRALHQIMQGVEGTINMATGQTHSIRQVVNMLSSLTGLADRVVWDSKMPGGQLFRAYDVSKLTKAGFTCQYDLLAGLKETYCWYEANAASARKDGP